ncbi:MAG: peptide deformylase [Fermentimonas sp.]|nr:peptide deformylase [Fermentimonas sp.]
MNLKALFCIILFSTQFTLIFSQSFTERELEIIHSGDESTPLRILQTTDKVDSLILRMQSEDIDEDSITGNESLKLIIKRLQTTLYNSGGVGIAAPQVGVLKNIFLFTRIDHPEHPVQIAINPKIVNHPDETVCFERDGCLSIPEISGNSIRYPWIEVEYFNEAGLLIKERLEGYSRKDNFTSVIFQHEYDHLNGILFTDKLCQCTLSSEELQRRVSLDFNRSREDILKWIQDNQNFTPTEEQLNQWEETGTLEFRIIDGQKRYFRNAAPNIFRIDAEARKLINRPVKSAESGAKHTLDNHLDELSQTEIIGKYNLPEITTHLRYTITVPEGEVKEGELVKAWLPFPRKDVGRQTNVELISVSQNDYILSDDKTDHTSIYMQQTAKEGEPVSFSAEFTFTSRGEWYDLNQLTPKPYDKKSDLYKKYTSEKPPHTHFSDNIRSLTDSITRYDKTEIESLKSIYNYITENFPWASALEYSTIPDIPEYVLENKKGDCGQVALLLINMLRYKGIPARWQSGWMTHPGEVNLHDWVEVYFEGVGWIPVDVSFGRGEPLNNSTGRSFFMSGIDSYRLYINNDFSGKFYPAKQFPRSETVDFQRGEVETKKENLYFNRWNYKMEVISQEKVENK